MAKKNPVQVQAVLGESVVDVEEILSLSEGSILMLDQPAEEPIDLFVSGKKIAKGEVIVRHDRYGLRITHVVPPIQKPE